jgi:hypothetical protein
VRYCSREDIYLMIRTISFRYFCALLAEMLLEKWINYNLFPCGVPGDFPDELAGPASLGVSISFGISIVIIIGVDLGNQRQGLWTSGIPRPLASR